MTEARDPYAVLGVARDASISQIRAAYVAHARRAHPDLNGERGIEVMRDLNEAWEILKDAARRRAWDAADGGPAGGPRSSLGGRFPDDADGRPFWTGAMGAPPGRPFGPVLDFGIYEGWSLGEIARVDRGYLVWLRDRPEGAALENDLARLLEPATSEVDPRPGRRRWCRGA